MMLNNLYQHLFVIILNKERMLFVKYDSLTFVLEI